MTIRTASDWVPGAPKESYSLTIEGFALAPKLQSNGLHPFHMTWRDRANLIRRFYADRDALRLVRATRARAGGIVQGMIDDSSPALLVDRGLSLIAAYHEACETDEAFEILRRGLDVLAEMAVGLGLEAIDNRILVPIRSRVELMYDEKTAERLTRLSDF